MHLDIVSHNIIKIKCLLNFFGSTFTSNNIPYWVMTGDLLFIFYCPVMCKTIQYVGLSLIGQMKI